MASPTWLFPHSSGTSANPARRCQALMGNFTSAVSVLPGGWQGGARSAPGSSNLPYYYSCWMGWGRAGHWASSHRINHHSGEARVFGLLAC
jgi:hypothetical protein